MTDENSDLTEIMSRLESRLDAMEKGELPPQLREHMKSKKGGDEEKKPEKEEGDDMKEDKDDEKMYKGEEYSDVISSEYLSWMENTLKSAGVDTLAARNHFDALEKAQLGGFDNPDAVNGSPSTNAISALTSSGGKTPAGAMGPVSVAKGYLNSENVSEADLEAAYEVYKAAALEQHFRNDLEGNFAARFNNEMEVAKAEAEKAAFDARAPLTDIVKSIEALSERIDNIGAGAGTTIQKSASTIDIPSTQDLANMGWDEVHALAHRTLRGE